MTSSTSPDPAVRAHDDSGSYAQEARIARTVGITLAWWLHGGLRLLLAVAMLYYGVAKLVLGQFGVADTGDALIQYGEMSPMGMLWRMVAFSPLFQLLAGLAEAGAGVALLWRRSVPLGAMIAAASMSLVFVLNLGYDVPVKQISLGLLVLSLLVLIPWMPRLARAVLGRGEISRGPVPTLVPWRPLARVTDVLGPIAGAALVALVFWGMGTQFYPERASDESAPAGVWIVQQDTAEPAAQLAEDTRWQQVAFGDVSYDGSSQVQVRRADGSLLEGQYQRTGQDAVELTLHAPREEGQTFAEYSDAPAEEMTLQVAEGSDGTLHLSGEGQDLVLAENPEGRILFDRGFSWPVRADDPFNR